LILLPFYLSSDRSLSGLLLLPFALIPLLIGTLSLGITLSTINVFFRDTNFVMSFIFNLLFYITPVFYPKSYIPVKWQWLVDINPAVYLLNPFRSVIYFEGNTFWIDLLKALGISILLLCIAVGVWKRKRNDFYHKL
jgi:ABC-type polysaccharide/polyol phosphate export permease